MVSFVFIANKIHRNFFYQIEVDLVKLYAPAVHRLKKKWNIGISRNENGTYQPCHFSGYGIYQVYPKILLVHTFYQFFWDMEYSRDIPKKFRYIQFFSFYGIWDIQGISPKITVHSVRDTF